MATNLFVPHQSRSLSLLGRVTHVEESTSSPPGTTSAFFWPPQKSTATTLVHPAPRLEVSNGSHPPLHAGLAQLAHSAAEKQLEEYANDAAAATESKKESSPEQTAKQSHDLHPPLIPETAVAPQNVAASQDSATADDTHLAEKGPADNEVGSKSLDNANLPTTCSAGNKKDTKGIETEEV